MVGLGFNQDTGANNRTSTARTAWAAPCSSPWFRKSNELKVGATYDQGHSGFFQTTGWACLAQPLRISAQLSPVQTSLTGTTKTWSLLATDTYSVKGPWMASAATVSGRYNNTDSKTIDRINPIPPNLDGDFNVHEIQSRRRHSPIRRSKP